MIYHFGMLYDTIISIGDFDVSAGTSFEWQIGEKIGLIAYWVLFDLQDYYYPYVPVLYPEQFDDDFL